MGPVSRRLLGLLAADVGDTRPSVLELGCGPGAAVLFRFWYLAVFERPS
ncbi:MAG: hypothetical protein ACRDF7_02885 [Candidatus Limnocylindrales bacterium]